MAAMTPQFRKQIKELGVNGTCWTAPDGETFEIHHSGAFLVHTICITRKAQKDCLNVSWNTLKKYNFDTVKYCEDNGIDPFKSVRDVQYKALRYHSGRHGGYEYTTEFKTFEEFKALFEEFKAGYNEYLLLKKEQKVQERLNTMEGDF